MARISAPAKPKKLAQENSVVQAFLIDPAGWPRSSGAARSWMTLSTAPGR